MCTHADFEEQTFAIDWVRVWVTPTDAPYSEIESECAYEIEHFNDKISKDALVSGTARIATCLATLFALLACHLALVF